MAEIVPNYTMIGGVYFDGIIAQLNGKTINPPRLAIELLAAFPPPAAINPSATGDTVVEVYVPPPATQVQADALDAVILAHDHTVLTPEALPDAAIVTSAVATVVTTSQPL